LQAVKRVKVEAMIQRWHGYTLLLLISLVVVVILSHNRIYAQLEPQSRLYTQNGDFSAGMAHWAVWGWPTLDAVQYRIENGVFEFYRQPGTQQALVMQNTGLPTGGLYPLNASFSLGNTSDQRKRVSVLLHDLDFSDVQMCTFWLPPHTPLTSYHMSTFPTDDWSSATFSVYASTAGEGWLQLDNVAMYEFTTDDIGTSTICYDPFVPDAP
jgi:hypothetical protein